MQKINIPIPIDARIFFDIIMPFAPKINFKFTQSKAVDLICEED
jgi:hypothetical protein